LVAEGFAVDTRAPAPTGYTWPGERYDAILLDIMLPGCRLPDAQRCGESWCLILMLTPKTASTTSGRSGLGADDTTKPFRRGLLAGWGLLRRTARRGDDLAAGTCPWTRPTRGCCAARTRSPERRVFQPAEYRSAGSATCIQDRDPQPFWDDLLRRRSNVVEVYVG